MIKLEPQGTKIIVVPIATENFKTESGIEIVQLEVDEGEVIEVSQELSHIYKVGDKIIYDRGTGMSLQYKKKSCLILDGQGSPKGNVIAIVTNE